MRRYQFDNRFFLNPHQTPALPQSEFISFFSSLITNAWLRTTSLSLRFSASKRLRSTGFNGRLLRNDARTPTASLPFPLVIQRLRQLVLGRSSFIVLARSMSFKTSNFCSGVNIRRTFFAPCISSMSFRASLERLTFLTHFCLLSKKTGQNKKRLTSDCRRIREKLI